MRPNWGGSKWLRQEVEAPRWLVRVVIFAFALDIAFLMIGLTVGW